MLISGTAGNDALEDTVGDDTILAGAGDDYVTSGAGDDLLSGEDGDDFMFSLSGNDTLIGGNGNDILLFDGATSGEAYGGDGTDILASYGGAVTLDGGAGNDLFVLQADSAFNANMLITMGAGADVLGLYPTTGAPDFPAQVTVTDFNVAEDRFGMADAENPFETDIDSTGFSISSGMTGAVATSAGGDWAVMFDGVSVLDMLGGNMTFTNVSYGTATADRIFAGTSDDIIVGGAGNDTIDGGEGDDVILGGAGNDSLNAGRGNDTVDGGDGNDVIHGEKGNNLLLGGAGDDYITSGDQASTIDGGLGDDQIVLRMKAGGDHIVTGGAGADHFDFQYIWNKHGEVTITDIELGVDSITLDGRDAIDVYFDGLATLTDTDAGAVLSYGNCDVMLAGVSVDDIANWYYGAPVDDVPFVEPLPLT